MVRQLDKWIYGCILDEEIDDRQINRLQYRWLDSQIDGYMDVYWMKRQIDSLGD